MATLADGFAAALRAVLAHCLSGGPGPYTPSDFPLAGLDQRSLAAVLRQFRGPADQRQETS